MPSVRELDRLVDVEDFGNKFYDTGNTIGTTNRDNFLDVWLIDLGVAKDLWNEHEWVKCYKSIPSKRESIPMNVWVAEVRVLVRIAWSTLRSQIVGIRNIAAATKLESKDSDILSDSLEFLGGKPVIEDMDLWFYHSHQRYGMVQFLSGFSFLTMFLVARQSDFKWAASTSTCDDSSNKYRRTLYWQVIFFSRFVPCRKYRKGVCLASKGDSESVSGNVMNSFKHY